MKDNRFKPRYNWAKIDPLIIQIYESGQRGVIKTIMQKYDVPSSTISARARKLGLNSLLSQNRESPKKYCEKENEILIAHHDKPAGLITTKLNKAGFRRNTKSIINHLTVLRQDGRIPFPKDHRDEKGIMTTLEISELMGISPMSIWRKINEGLLKATEQEKNQDSIRHRRFLVKRKDLRDFLVTYPAHWDHRKCDQLFLIDILDSGQSRPVYIQHSAGTKESNGDRDII